MPTFSVITWPSTTHVGTRPRGLMARYSGLRCWPAAVSIFWVSYARPVSSRVMWEASEQAPGE
jgi:hypothetical protein